MYKFTLWLAAGLLVLPGIGHAQSAPEVSTDPMQIVGDPDLEAGERISRAIALLNSLADSQDVGGIQGGADRLRSAAYVLSQAPANGEASELASQVVMAAEQGALDEALILAQSAAALSPSWAHSVEQSSSD